MKRALLLINAGARQAKELKDKVAPALREAGLDLIEASEPNPSHFAEIIQRFADKIDLVVVAGGDGTSLCAAKAMMGKKLPLGIIPLGTANNLARSLNIPLEIKPAAEIIAQGRTQDIDVATVNGNPFLNVSGMGLSTNVNKIVPAESKKRWGLMAYIIYSVSLLRRARRFRATVEHDGQMVQFKSRQITVCNGRYYGSGLSIAPDASLTDGQLDLVSAHFSRWWKALLLIPLYLLKRHNPRQGLHLLKASKFKIVTDPPLDLDTDGEITSRTPASYEVLRGALTVFAP